jgi:copper chaperone CopZ
MTKSCTFVSKFRNMKKYILLIAVVIGFAACKQKTGTSVSVKAPTVAVIKSVNLAVEGMTCSGCENTVKTAVAKLEGVKTVSASAADAVAVVAYDTTKVNIQQISEAITGVGYVVKGEKAPVGQTKAKE